ncbi:hypothetical protein [Caldimonas sp. KR1-144]|uniref:hypothetical protein n=1 Tax=Caldimonas sp. KR1-144 TaxID=3400911 RepID=UPI003C2E3277
MVRYVKEVQDHSTTVAVHPVDRLLDSMTKGSAAIVAPMSANQYEDFPVALAVSGSALGPLLADIQATAGPDSHVVGIAGVRLSPRMRAELIGGDFEIQGESLQEQAVATRGNTTWQWTVRSAWPGERTLRVRLHALVLVQGQETPRSFNVAEHRLTVRIDATEWAIRNWQWVASALALPLLAFVYQTLWKRNGIRTP